jgi:quercetin dioxygenase-like cupin family protein
MFTKMVIVVSLVAATLLCSATFAKEVKDAVVADPGHYSVEFENDRVRIIRIKYGPGEKSVMHTHGPNVAVFLSDGMVRMNAPDGTHQDVPSEIGVAQWADAEKHLPENLGDEPLEVVLIELKD